jgi:hypothetical protein
MENKKDPTTSGKDGCGGGRDEEENSWASSADEEDEQDKIKLLVAQVN